MRHEPWEMGVHKRNGVVYLDVHKLPERPQSELDRRRYNIRIIYIDSKNNSYCILNNCILGSVVLVDEWRGNENVIGYIEK